MILGVGYLHLWPETCGANGTILLKYFAMKMVKFFKHLFQGGRSQLISHSQVKTKGRKLIVS